MQEKNNKYIKEYLDYYCNPKKTFPFAVLLKGKWGCGKTYFIKKYINSTKGRKILHVSLYGVDDFKGIMEKIIVELLPFVPKKHNKLASYIISNIKRIPKIKDWIPSDIDEFLVDIFLKKDKESIFVFDDLERCKIEIDKLLGYINHFVEFKNQKVILIANEEDILKSKSGDKYREIKEKLIGKEFCINSSQKEAVDLFVGELQNEELIGYSNNIKELLSKIFVQSKYDNLRLIQQALFHFEYFFRSFSSKAKRNFELFEKMFYEFVVIFIEYKKGNIKSEDFFNEYPQFFRGLHKDKTPSHFLDKYDNEISYWIACFDVAILGKILQGIDLSENEKKDLVDKLENLVEINKESWQKLWSYYDESDEEYFENLKDVQEKWKKKEYSDFFVVLHVFGIFLRISEVGLLHKSKKDIFNEATEYVDFLIINKKFPLNLQQKIGFSWKESSYGLGYSGIESEEWKKFMDFIDNKIEDLKETFIKHKITTELMPILRGKKDAGQSLDLLINYNFFHNAGNKEAYFQYVDLNEITEILVKTDRSFFNALLEAFKRRYDMATQINGIEQEVPFFEKLKSKLESEIKVIEKKFGDRKTPRSVLLQSFISQSIEPFIKGFASAKTLDDSTEENDLNVDVKYIGKFKGFKRT